MNTFIFDPSAMTLSTAQPAQPAQPATAQPSAPPGEPTFLLSGSASECMRQLAQRFPRLLTAQTMRELPAKLPATRGYDFRNPRPLSEVLARLCTDLKLPALAKVAQQWRKLRALPHAAVMTSAEWDAVLGGRAQLASPARFGVHGRPVEGWASPWIADERAAYWGPTRCYHCALTAGLGALFYFPHSEPCAPQCSGLGGRCGSPLCDGCCVGCIRGRDPECPGVCGAGGPCQVFVEDSPGSEDGEWVDPDALPAAQQPVIDALRGGPCVEGEGAQHEQPDNEDDRQDAPAEQPAEHALIKPPAQPTKPQPGPTKPKPTAHAAPSPELSPPAAPAALPVAPSLPILLTDDAKRLAAPRIQSPTAKPPAKRKPLDVAGALAALAK